MIHSKKSADVCKTTVRGPSVLVLGMLALALIFGFVLAGCATGAPAAVASAAEATASEALSVPNNDPKIIEVTGFNLNLPVTTNRKGTGKFIFLSTVSEMPDRGSRSVVVMNPGENITVNILESGTPWVENAEPWTGTGKFFIVAECGIGKYAYSSDGVNPTKVDITDALTTLEWSKFIKFADVNWN